jgi:hypothetical protein
MRKFDVKVKKSNGGGPQPDPFWSAVAALLKAIPSQGWAVIAIVVGVLTVGTPHLLISYSCSGKCNKFSQQHDCAYLGVQGMRRNVPPHQGKCSAITFLPLDL